MDGSGSSLSSYNVATAKTTDVIPIIPYVNKVFESIISGDLCVNISKKL
jgi:hypothetical protein